MVIINYIMQHCWVVALSHVPAETSPPPMLDSLTYASQGLRLSPLSAHPFDARTSFAVCLLSASFCVLSPRSLLLRDLPSLGDGADMEGEEKIEEEAS
jgi:hypothetical protein